VRAVIDGNYSSSDESRRLRRHQLPPTDPLLSPEDFDEESLPEEPLENELPPDELLPESLESFEELFDEAGADSGAGVRSCAGSGVESLPVESLGEESPDVDSVFSLAPLDDPLDEDLREIGRRRRVLRAGFSSAASSTLFSA